MRKLILYLNFILLPMITIKAQEQTHADLEGRWDLEIEKDGAILPSWLEIRHSGIATYVGRFVYAFGSARPIAEIKKYGETSFTFTIPVQWEAETGEMKLSGTLKGEEIIGEMIYVDGKSYPFKGVKAPELLREEPLVWGAPRNLIDRNSLSGWHAEGKNQWTVKGGILTNPSSGANLRTKEVFTDFKLHIEFRYPKKGNSGIYLRGRYEVQVEDSKGMQPWDIHFGSIYGFLPPNRMVAKEAGEWQTYDITLIGRKVTVVANGVPVIVDQIIPGITGGAIDSKEGEPGPILLQGDHTAVEYRNIVITPAM